MKLQIATFAACSAAVIGETNLPGLAVSEPLFQPRSLAAMTHEEAAVCWIDAMKFGPYLAQAGLAINKATQHCDGFGNTPHECAADILDTVSSVSFAASFIAAAVEKCGPATNAEAAKCAEDIADLVGSVTAMGAGTSDVTSNCPAPAVPPPAPDFVPEKGQMIGICVVDSVQSAWYLARAGLMINSAIIECEQGDVAKCAARITGVINSVAAAATFIVKAVSECSHNNGHGVECTKSVLKLVTALSGIATHAISVHTDCASTTRRLANATDVGEERRSLPKLGADEVAHLATLNITEDEMAANPLRVIRTWKFESEHTESPPVVV